MTTSDSLVKVPAVAPSDRGDRFAAGGGDVYGDGVYEGTCHHEASRKESRFSAHGRRTAEKAEEEVS